MIDKYVDNGIKIEIGMTYPELFIIMAIIAVIEVALGNLCISIAKKQITFTR